MGDKNFSHSNVPMVCYGHLTSFLHLSNKLAERGHKISFFIPSKTLHKLEQFNLHQDLITFLPVIVPHVEGLPFGAETTEDASLQELKPQFIFFDFAHWLPSVARPLGIKSIHYCIISSAATGYLIRGGDKFKNNKLRDQKSQPIWASSSFGLLKGSATIAHLSFLLFLAIEQQKQDTDTPSKPPSFYCKPTARTPWGLSVSLLQKRITNFTS